MVVTILDNEVTGCTTLPEHISYLRHNVRVSNSCCYVDRTVALNSKTCTILNTNYREDTVFFNSACMVNSDLLAIHIKCDVLAINICQYLLACVVHYNIVQTKVEVAEQLDSLTVLSFSKRLGKVAVNLSANLNSRSQLDILASVDNLIAHLVDTAEVECHLACTNLVDTERSLCILK